MSNLTNIIGTLCLATILSLPAAAYCGTVKGRDLENDGRISIFSYHTKDYVEVTYRRDGEYDPEAIEKIEYAMRSRGDDKVHAIDRGVIELMDHLQDRFGADTIEVISGYRSKAFNESLRESGVAAASESLHIKGLAVDLHIDEVSEGAVFDYLKRLALGGVGYYPKQAFVHADVGPHRTWEKKPSSTRVLVGTDNNPNPAWAAVTDKDLYRPGETLSVVIKNNGYDDLDFSKEIWSERFRKGDWKERRRLVKEKGGVKLSAGESASHSWKIPKDQGLGKYRLVFYTSSDRSIPPAYSNEFYVRKR